MYEFNKLLKKVNENLPVGYNIRYEKQELALYTIGKVEDKPIFTKQHLFGTGSKKQVTPFLGGMLAYAGMIKEYQEERWDGQQANGLIY